MATSMATPNDAMLLSATTALAAALGTAWLETTVLPAALNPADEESSESNTTDDLSRMQQA